MSINWTEHGIFVSAIARKFEVEFEVISLVGSLMYISTLFPIYAISSVVKAFQLGLAFMILYYL